MRRKKHTKQRKNVKKFTPKVMLHYLDFAIKRILEIMSIMDTISRIING